MAGLEGAKEALKEAVILPIKFPQLFTGIIKRRLDHFKAYFRQAEAMERHTFVWGMLP